MMVLAPEQQDAVNSPLTPVLVIAGAGTGKTTVLISRIIKYIKENNIDHRKILTITFTNKARDEIRDRLFSKLGGINVPAEIFTFHAFFHKILKKDIEKIDKNLRNFQLMDDGDQRAIIKRISKRFLKNEQIKPRTLQTALSRIKSATEYKKNPSSDVIFPFAKKLDLDEDLIKEILQEYNDELRDSNFLDYDDLEIFANEVLNFKDVREFWSDKYDAILIDEFQDTSSLQFEILKKLVSDKKSNLFCVGDPDQSIYGFRGAKPEVCNEFVEYFENVLVKKLQINYRSTKNILLVSNHLINKFKNKFSKVLKTDNEWGEKVDCCVFSSDGDESSWVVKNIQKILEEDKSCSLNDIAILFRNNNLSKPYEIALQQSKFNYYVVNSIEFFARAEIKFITGVIYLLCAKSLSFIHLDNIRKGMSIGIGESVITDFCKFAKENKYSFFEAVEHISENQISKKSISSIRKFAEKMRKILDQKDKLNIDQLIDYIVEIFEYREYVLKKKEESRLDNIEKLGELLRYDYLNSSLEEISSSLPLAGNNKNDKSNSIVLSTIHQMKGLEFKYVFVVKMSGGIFPSLKSSSFSRKQEERRLAYVAFTRAKKRLFISASSSKYAEILGFSIQSEFIDEIKDLDSIEYGYYASSQSSKKSFWSRNSFES